MPCDDVTELLRIRLDEGDRLVGYELIKRTCGRAVGERSLLGDFFAGKDAHAILELTADDFVDEQPATSEEETFLALKHFFAVQSGLRVLLGLASGGVTDGIRVASVGYENNEVVLVAEVVVEVLTEKIKSCGKCKGCGVLTAKKLALL